MKCRVYSPPPNTLGMIMREALIKKLKCSAKRGDGNVGVRYWHRDQGPGSLGEENFISACTCDKYGLPHCKGTRQNQALVPSCGINKNKMVDIRTNNKFLNKKIDCPC